MVVEGLLWAGMCVVMEQGQMLVGSKLGSGFV